MSFLKRWTLILLEEFTEELTHLLLGGGQDLPS
jgi:hypothetical protein